MLDYSESCTYRAYSFVKNHRNRAISVVTNRARTLSNAPKHLKRSFMV